MLVDVLAFGQEFSFREDAMEALCCAELALRSHPDAVRMFAACRGLLFAGDNTYWSRLDTLAEEAGVHRFTVHQLFLIFCTEETRRRYHAAGYSKAFYRDSMKDLRHKMEETYQVHGIWGVYCGPWLSALLALKCFCLGRLQFEILPSEFHYELAGHTLHPHDPVINIHVPSFGKLDHSAVLDAYGRAAAFFGHLFPDGAVWFHCESWILYPQMQTVFPGGNLKRFSADFDIVHAFIDPMQDDRYRVFFLPPEIPMETYPETNALQRNLKAWLLDGNTMGVGFGLFLWKHGSIIPRS